MIDTIVSNVQEDLDTKDLEKSNEIKSVDDDLGKIDQKIINKKIDKQEFLIKEGESKKDIQVLQNKKQKSNFI